MTTDDVNSRKCSRFRLVYARLEPLCCQCIVSLVVGLSVGCMPCCSFDICIVSNADGDAFFFNIGHVFLRRFIERLILFASVYTFRSVHMYDCDVSGCR